MAFFMSSGKAGLVFPRVAPTDHEARMLSFWSMLALSSMHSRRGPAGHRHALVASGPCLPLPRRDHLIEAADCSQSYSTSQTRAQWRQEPFASGRNSRGSEVAQDAEIGGALHVVVAAEDVGAACPLLPDVAGAPAAIGQ